MLSVGQLPGTYFVGIENREAAMAMTVSQMREEWADRAAIEDCLLRYTRGIDRADPDLLRSVYWPDATDDHAGLFTGAATDYVEQAIANGPARMPTVHFNTNAFIRIDGDEAKAESYVYAIHCDMDVGGEKKDVVVSARFLDRFEKRADEWRIAARVVTIDWFREYSDAADWTIGPFGLGNAGRGAKMPQDKSYSWLGL